MYDIFLYMESLPFFSLSYFPLFFLFLSSCLSALHPPPLFIASPAPATSHRRAGRRFAAIHCSCCPCHHHRRKPFSFPFTLNLHHLSLPYSPSRCLSPLLTPSLYPCYTTSPELHRPATTPVTSPHPADKHRRASMVRGIRNFLPLLPCLFRSSLPYFGLSGRRCPY